MRQVQVLLPADVGEDTHQAVSQVVLVHLLDVRKGKLLELPGRDDLIGCRGLTAHYRHGMRAEGFQIVVNHLLGKYNRLAEELVRYFWLLDHPTAHLVQPGDVSCRGESADGHDLDGHAKLLLVSCELGGP